MTAVSGMIAVAVGAILGVRAPCLLLEEFTESSYSIGPITPFPILPALIVVVGIFSLASALRGDRHLSPLTSICLGLFITSLTFWVPGGESAWRIDKYGYPFSWLVWFTGLSGMNQHIMGIIALTFLIDLALWTLIAGVIILDIRYLRSYFSGRRRMERR